MSKNRVTVKAFPVRKLENGVPRFIGYFPFLVDEHGTVHGHAISPFDEEGRQYGRVYPTPEAALKAYVDQLALKASAEAVWRLQAEKKDGEEWSI